MNEAQPASICHNPNHRHLTREDAAACQPADVFIQVGGDIQGVVVTGNGKTVITE